MGSLSPEEHWIPRANVTSPSATARPAGRAGTPHPATCKDMDKRRADIADTLSQAVFAFGRRPTRYRGCMKPHLQHIATAASITLHRYVDWILKVPQSRTDPSPCAP